MNIKRFIIAALAIFLLNQITDFIIHGLILGQTYMSMPELWRPDMMSKMWIMYITSIVFASFFIFIFIKGYEKKGILEGLKFGLIMGILINTLGSFNQYVIYPIPFSLAISWFCYGMLQFIIYGIAASLIYKEKK